MITVLAYSDGLNPGKYGALNAQAQRLGRTYWEQERFAIRHSTLQIKLGQTARACSLA